MRNGNQFLNLTRRFAMVVAFASLVFAGAPSSAQAIHADPQPTPLTGESWLLHLGRSFDETSMGKTGRLGPAEVTDDTPRQLTSAPRQLVDENEAVTVRGSDLYRMNCRGCHGENGAGAPPEINSVINPVRATSAAVIMERVRQTGSGMSQSDAVKLAEQSKTMLLDRLHHGGHDMPAFPHLSDGEINSLLAYLRQLAQMPRAESQQIAVREARLRVGEHIAKSTCHICHSAAGANPTLAQLYQGAIPPLSTLVLRTTPAQFIRKVTQGAPIRMGEPPQLLRGRMPVFYYLSEEEAADVYLYLKSFPPEENEMLEAAAVISTSAADPDPKDPTAPRQLIPLQFANMAEPNEVKSQAMLAQEQLTILALLLGLLACMVLCLGFWFSLHELRRLSGDSVDSGRALVPNVSSRLDAELVA
jgi:mono/diheme cytochrome c family protein